MLWAKGPASSFYIYISNCHSTICWKVYPFPHWNPWHFFQKSVDHKYMGSRLDSQFSFIDLYVNPYVGTCCLYYCSFNVNFNVGNCKFSNFVPKLFWLFCVLCISIQILRPGCQCLPLKKFAYILIGMASNLLISLASIAILTIQNLPIHEHRMSLHLFRLSLISFRNAM